MSSIFSELGGITGGVAAEGLAFAAGFAAGRALEPAAVTISQDAWNAAQVRRLPAEEAAVAAAQDLSSLQTMTDEASYSGFDASRFAYLYHAQLTAPGMGELLRMLRRGSINSGNFTHGLNKAQLEPMWDGPLADLANDRLDPAIIAVAIQRGIMKDPGFLPVGPPTGVGNVQAFPVSPIDALTEAEASGWNSDRLFVQTAIQGLPISLIQGAQGYFRGILTKDDYYRAVAEGNTRNEWRDAILDTSRQILTAGEYAELQLRGYYDRATRLNNTAKHGMSSADSDLLYDVLGRAPGIHAVTTGLARGGTYDGQPKTIPEPFLSAVERANIRPEWYDIEYANRYTYPSAFVLRTLATSGDLGGEAAVEQVLLEIGWPPHFAATVATAWTGGAKSGDPNEKKAQTQLWTATHKSYVAEEIDDATAATALAAAGVAAAAVQPILTLWAHERSLIRKQLSPAQIKKALSSSTINPATGAAWTQAEATAALLARGYDQNDATVLLTE